jgi:O-antigen/teichoic acid export membrane protein
MASIDERTGRGDRPQAATRTRWRWLRWGGLSIPLSPLTVRGLRSSAFSGSRYLARPALNLIATPILLSQLGATQYGIWMIVTTLLSVGAIADFGILDSTIRYVSKYHALGDERAVVRTIRSAVSVCGALGLCCMALLFAISDFAAMHIFHVSANEQDIVVAAIRISGVYFLFGFISAGFRSALRGHHRFDLDAKLDVSFEVLMTGTNLVLAWSGQGLPAIMGSIALWRMAEIGATALVLKRTSVPTLVVWPLFSREVLGESAGYAVFVWLQGVSAALLANFDRFLIANQLGPEVLAYYAISLQLAQQIHGLLVNALAFLFPMFSEVGEVGSKDALAKLYRKAFAVTVIAALVIAVPLYALGPLIVRLWLGAHASAMVHVLLRILVCYYLVVAMTIAPHYFLNGTGASRLNALLAAASTGVSIATALVLLPHFGTAGVALARLGIVPVCAIFWWIVHRRLDLSSRWTVLPVALSGAAIVAAVLTIE